MSAPPRSRLQVRRRLAPLHDVLPTLRWLTVTVLVGALLLGGGRWLTRPHDAGALEFTIHSVINSLAAKGILGTVITDIDGDNDNDILTAGLNGVHAYLNEGKYSFTHRTITDRAGERIQIVDFDNDGALDLLISYPNTKPGVRWYRNNGNVSFSETTIDVGNNEKAGFAADLDADGDTDIATIIEDSIGILGIRVWQNDGNGTFSALWSANDTGTRTITVGKIEGETYPQIITGGDQGLQRWKTADGTSWNRSDIDDDNANETFLVVVDIDGDGNNDIVALDQNLNQVVVYHNTGGGNFARHVLPEDTDAMTAVPADLNGDGNTDLVVVGQDDNTVYWYEHSGALEFTRHTLAANLSAVFSAAVGDLDKDNDLDFFAASHHQGRGFAYERIRAKPVGTQPDNILQSSLGTGKISFQTTVSDDDLDPTRMRLQYSLDGIIWEKPWLTSVKPSRGSVDLKNSNGYQVGTSNPIDTDTNSEVTLTVVWDTKSINNTGGPIIGDPNSVQLRVLPRDNRNSGSVAVSGEFVVDNAAPQGATSLAIADLTTDQVTLTWPTISDRGGLTYKIYYGTDQAAVLELRSSVWDSETDPGLADSQATTTTITGLTAGTTYTFKLAVTDDFGNRASTPSARVTTLTVDTPAGETITPPPEDPPPPTPSPSTTIEPSPTGTAIPTPTSPSPSLLPTVSPSPSRVPSVLEDNQPPLADAGGNQVVNPSALVILDGTMSIDADQRIVSYSWRQLDGPRVRMLSATTATPSFAAGSENETYIFLLTVRDTHGAMSTDTVTVATKSLPETKPVPVTVNTVPTTSPSPPSPLPIPPLVQLLLHPIDLILFVLAVLSTILLLFERIIHAVGRGQSARQAVTGVSSQVRDAQGKVVHYKTGEPIVGAQVMVYGSDKKLRASERTNAQGVFPTYFPVGQYTLGVQATGFSFAPAAARALAPDGGILYSGGNLIVRDSNKPLAIVIPMKPIAGEVSSRRARLLHFWQFAQHLGRVLSWPIFILGALLNTVLVFIAPRPLYLIIEVAYIILVILKIALEVRVRPAYGQVRDAITHVPLDLAVVRLFEKGTNRLVMTRVTNNQGKFFALPPAGTYTVTISKPGYAIFSKEGVEIKSEHDTTLQVIADLMPVAPHATGLQHARAAVL